MAAFSGQSRRDLRKSFNDLVWDRPLSFEDFIKQVEETKARGWAIDDGYYATGTASVAVPVFDSTGLPAMACSATMFIHQYDAKRAESIAADLTKVSRTLAQALPHL
jgi:DNA-binding IclR family transcriptional regulator